MCEEKTQLLLKSLPQKLRRHLVPLPAYAQSFLERCLDSDQFGVGDYVEQLIRDIQKERGIEIARTDFRPEALPQHLFMNFRLIDEHGRQLELDRNLVKLRAEFGGIARNAFQALAQEGAVTAKVETSKSDSEKPTIEISQGGYRSWDFGDLPETLEIKKGNKLLFGYPALVDRGESCDLEVFDDLQEAQKIHHQGLRKLFAIANKDTLKSLQKQLPGIRELGLLFINIGSVDALVEQILNVAIERAFMSESLPTNAQQFQERLQAGKPRMALIAQEIAKHALNALQANLDVQKKIAQAKASSASAYADIQNQLQGLIFPKFVSDIPYAQLVPVSYTHLTLPTKRIV